MDFGVFSDFFDNRPNHLPLLNLVDDGEEVEEHEYQELTTDISKSTQIPEKINKEESFSLKTSSEKLKKIVIENGKNSLFDGIDLLLNHPDWRKHLVAAITICYIKEIYNENISKKLWERLDSGSWVSPQICVMLSRIDPDFTNNAVTFIRNESGNKYPENLSIIQSHSMRGPAGKEMEDSKLSQAILFLLGNKIDKNIIDYNGALIAERYAKNYDIYYSKYIKLQES